MAYQQMTIIISVCINTDVWNFEQDKKESGLKTRLEMIIDEELQEIHGHEGSDVGVLDVDFEYGEQL